MPSFREEFRHFNEALVIRRDRASDQELVERWTLALATCRYNISNNGLPAAREKKLVRHADKAARQVRSLSKLSERDAIEMEARGAMSLSLWVLRRRIQWAILRKRRSH